MLVPLPIFHVARPPAWNTDPNIWPGDKNRRSAAAAHENGSMSVSHTSETPLLKSALTGLESRCVFYFMDFVEKNTIFRAFTD